jgi:uncharacterized surface protein with fasciclin (FAS1) repeats
MTRKIKAPHNLIMSVAGLGLVAVLSACESPSITSSDVPSPAAPLSESPTGSNSSPAVGQSPVNTKSNTLAKVIEDDASFSTLKDAVKAAGLEEQLQQSTPPVTIFAPTNEAFARLPDGTLDRLLQPENRETLRQILSYHLIAGNVTSADITPGETNSVGGQPLTMVRDSSGVTVNGVKVIKPDIAASNGVIHAVDQVLIPPGTAL